MAVSPLPYSSFLGVSQNGHGGFAESIISYKLPLPKSISPNIAVGVVIAEVGVAAMLLIAPYALLLSLSTALILLLLFSVVLTYVQLTSANASCNCFGEQEALGIGAFTRNAGLIGLTTLSMALVKPV